MPKGIAANGTKKSPLDVKADLEKKIAIAQARLENEQLKKQLRLLTEQNKKIRASNGKAKAEKKKAKEQLSGEGNAG